MVNITEQCYASGRDNAVSHLVDLSLFIQEQKILAYLFKGQISAATLAQWLNSHRILRYIILALSPRTVDGGINVLKSNQRN